MAHANTSNSHEAHEGFVKAGEALRSALADHPHGPAILHDPAFGRGSHLMVCSAGAGWAIFQASYWIDRHGEEDCLLEEVAEFATKAAADAGLAEMKRRRAAA